MRDRFSRRGESGASIYEMAKYISAASSSTETPKGASEWLNKRGIPGIRYLDEGSRNNQWAVIWPGGGFMKVSSEARAKEIASKERAKGQNVTIQGGTSNFVIFDESKIKITGENGRPIAPQDLSRDLPTPRGQAMPDVAEE